MSEVHKILNSYFVKFFRADKKTCYVSYSNAIEGYLEAIIDGKCTPEQALESIKRELNTTRNV